MSTLEANLKNLLEGDELVVLDYSSARPIIHAVQKAYGSALSEGRLFVSRVEGMTVFHPAHAKNIAHKLARRNIVCNLDADNLLTPAYANWIRGIFTSTPHGVTHGKGSIGGTFGRIALPKSEFIKLGGYDEALEGWGYEDDDLILRASGSGLRAIATPHALLKCLAHHDEIRCIKPVFGPRGKIENRLANKAISEVNIKAGRLVANAGRTWGTAPVLQYDAYGNFM